MRKLRPDIKTLKELYEMKNKFDWHGIPDYPDLNGDSSDAAFFLLQLFTGFPPRDILIEIEVDTDGTYRVERRSDFVLRPIWKYFDGLPLSAAFKHPEYMGFRVKLDNDDRVNKDDLVYLLELPYNRLNDHYKNWVDGFKMPVLWYGD